MMKLTVAFLAALAAADAAEARNHRQARRQYYGGGYGEAAPPAYSSKAETPAVSSPVVPSNLPSSAEPFKTSLPVDALSSYIPTPTPEVPEGVQSSVVVESPKETPVVPASSPVAASSAPPANSADYGAGYPVPSSPAVAPSSSGKVPSNSGIAPPSSAVPSGVYPSGGAGQPESSKVPSNSGIYPSGAVPSGTGNVAYPTGTGSKPSATPLTDYVTKTIYSTQIYHISSSLTTKVVPVGTTVCPQEEATKYPAPSSTPVKAVTSEYPVSEITKKVTETLVYTVGVGSTAHPVTTEVVSTTTSTIYKTIVVTPPTGEKTAYPEGKPDESTSTKTIKSTTTSTKYITVKPTPSGNVPVGQQGGKPSGPAEGECAPPVTVTVTAKETVYVTKQQEKPKPTPSAEKPGSGYPTQPQKPSGGAGQPVKPSATPSPLYPIGNNGTHPYPAGPTGFKTSTKPSGPVGTGSYGSVPSSLPAFSFASEVPAATPSSAKVPSNGQSTPAASATPSAAYPPAGGNYGPGYPEVPAVSSAKPSETPKVPSNNQSTPAATPTPAGSYGGGYGTY